ncbi:unnamed protein product [Closterium sp. NIES-53]
MTLSDWRRARTTPSDWLRGRTTLSDWRSSVSRRLPAMHTPTARTAAASMRPPSRSTVFPTRPRLPLLSLAPCLLLLLLPPRIPSASAFAPDAIRSLPGQPRGAPAFGQWAGYIPVGPAGRKRLFYWLTESVAAPLTKPLVLWLNGGPGCSSIGYGLLQELGPWRVAGPAGRQLQFNPYSWNKLANVLFLDSPAGAGFSYSLAASDLATGDNQTAQDTVQFLRAFLRRHPRYNGRKLLLAGESYAGHYIPQLADALVAMEARPALRVRMRVGGVLLGNPFVHARVDTTTRARFFLDHGLLSPRLFSQAAQCGFSADTVRPGMACDAVMNAIATADSGIDPYDIYAPVCLSPAYRSLHRNTQRSCLSRLFSFSSPRPSAPHSTSPSTTSSSPSSLHPASQAGAAGGGLVGEIQGESASVWGGEGESGEGRTGAVSGAEGAAGAMSGMDGEGEVEGAEDEGEDANRALSMPRSPTHSHSSPIPLPSLPTSLPPCTSPSLPPSLTCPSLTYPPPAYPPLTYTLLTYTPSYLPPSHPHPPPQRITAVRQWGHGGLDAARAAPPASSPSAPLDHVVSAPLDHVVSALVLQHGRWSGAVFLTHKHGRHSTAHTHHSHVLHRRPHIPPHAFSQCSPSSPASSLLPPNSPLNPPPPPTPRPPPLPQVGGWVTRYKGLTFVTVRGAGHQIPTGRPASAFTIFQHFLHGTTLDALHSY